MTTVSDAIFQYQQHRCRFVLSKFHTRDERAHWNEWAHGFAAEVSALCADDQVLADLALAMRGFHDQERVLSNRDAEVAFSLVSQRVRGKSWSQKQVDLAKKIAAKDRK